MQPNRAAALTLPCRDSIRPAQHLDALDQEGKELDGIEDAWETALAEAREMIEASVAEGRVDLSHFIKVRDASGNIVHRLRFREAITIVPEVPT